MEALSVAGTVGRAVRPRIGGALFRYRLYTPDMEESGEATYVGVRTVEAV
jgi:hypothetical protein